MIREFAPDVLVTHTDTDPFNPDHPVAYAAVNRARRLAAGAGVQSAFATVKPPELLLFEPHQPELCNFTPTTFVDITAVMEQKQAAMAEMEAQRYLQSYYAERADHRGNHARRSSGDNAIRQAEAFQRVTPAGPHRAMSGERTTENTVYGELAELGSATVYEAGGRGGYVDADLIQVLPGSRAAGPARTVRCGQDDNLMVHAVMAQLEPGEVLVLTMPEARPVALIGELLATQAKVRGAAAILVDASIRDVGELQELGLPIWARWVRVKGATKDIAGEIGGTVTVGGAEINQGDTVVLDADGVAVVPRRRIGDVLEASRKRAGDETVKRAQLEAGALSYELDGLHEKLAR